MCEWDHDINEPVSFYILSLQSQTTLGVLYMLSAFQRPLQEKLDAQFSDGTHLSEFIVDLKRNCIKLTSSIFHTVSNVLWKKSKRNVTESAVQVW